MVPMAGINDQQAKVRSKLSLGPILDFGDIYTGLLSSGRPLICTPVNDDLLIIFTSECRSNLTLGGYHDRSMQYSPHPTYFFLQM